MDEVPHMVQQVIKYSDGTETVINYRGVITDGVLKEDEPVEVKKTLKERIKKIIS